MNDTLNGETPTPGWHWRQTHWDNFIVYADEKLMRPLRPGSYVKSLDGTPPFSFKDYLSMCWWCGKQGINPLKQPST